MSDLESDLQNDVRPYKEIRAMQPTEDTVVVYQAYKASIAEAAVREQRLDASTDYRVGRMTWIKPSFLWCMYRSGWSYKDPNQSHILAITMKREGLVNLLREADLSTTKGVAESTVRVQWDPERDVRLVKLPYRSLQLGISGTKVRQWIDEWIVHIDDITEDVRRWKQLIDEDGKEGVRRVKRELAATRKEEVVEIDSELEIHLGMKSIEEDG